MGFWGKIIKISSIAMIAAGGTVTVGSAVMLGLGTNLTYSDGQKTLTAPSNMLKNSISTFVGEAAATNQTLTLKANSNLTNNVTLKLSSSEITSSNQNSGTVCENFNFSSTTSQLELNVQDALNQQNQFFSLDLSRIRADSIFSCSDSSVSLTNATITWSVSNGAQAMFSISNNILTNKCVIDKTTGIGLIATVSPSSSSGPSDAGARATTFSPVDVMLNIIVNPSQPTSPSEEQIEIEHTGVYAKVGSKYEIIQGVGSMNYDKEYVYVNGSLKKTISLGDIPGSRVPSYSEIVADMKQLKAELEKMPNSPDTKQTLELCNRVILANDLMIAGAVLVTISSLVLIAGIVLLLLNIKFTR